MVPINPGSCINNGNPLMPPQEPTWYHSRAGDIPPDSDFAMPSLVISYPTFDPVLVHLGPFAIRWYALAYIFGILIGWAYARLLIRSPKLWGGKAPLSDTDFDDFVLWVTLGIILGGRIGYVLFYNLPHFLRYPAEIIQLWNGGMSFHGDSPVASSQFCFSAIGGEFLSFRSGISPAQSERSDCFSAASPISSTASCGAGSRTCRGR